MCVRACACACMRACVRACVCACMCACVYGVGRCYVCDEFVSGCVNKKLHDCIELIRQVSVALDHTTTCKCAVTQSAVCDQP